MIQPADFSALLSPSVNARLLGGLFYYQHLANVLVTKFSDIADRPSHFFDFDDLTADASFCRCRALELLHRARGLLAQLDNIITIRTHSISPSDKSFLLAPALSHFNYRLHPVIKTPFNDALAIAGRDRTRSSIASRIHIELTDAYKSGKFIVFDTWTVDPARYSSNIFVSKNAAGERCYCMENYLKSLCDKVLARARPDLTARERRKLPNKYDYFQYFSVVERHKSGEYHCHLILIFSHLPAVEAEVDPNAFRSVPSLRQLVNYPRWPYGFSTPIAVRFSSDDAYANIGWKWPVKSGSPLSPSVPGQLAAYVSKYISKQPSKGALYRCRMTRNFGIRSLISHHRAQTLEQQMALFLFPQPLVYHGKKISPPLVRESLLRSIRITLRRSASMSLHSLKIITETLSEYHYPMSMLRQLPPSILQVQTIKHLNFVRLLIESLRNLDISNIYACFLEIPRVSSGSLS